MVIVAADEPTGNLDSANGKIIYENFRNLPNRGHTLIMITHDEDFAQCSDRLIRMVDGAIAEDVKLTTGKKSG